MKKFLAKMLACVLILTASCFVFAGCGGGEAAGNDVWKVDAVRGASEYENQHTYFAKFNETEGAVYIYSTDSQDKTRITAFAVFNCTYEQDGSDVAITPLNGYIHAMNGDNAIDMNFDADGAGTWWSNTVGESKTLTLGEDGSFELKAAE